jgi:hypothetical protein
MKTYNYFYDGQPISKYQFLKSVPEDWEKYVDEFGHYSCGYYSAEERDNDTIK